MCVWYRPLMGNAFAGDAFVSQEAATRIENLLQ
jgi:hypothetical protein